MTRPRKPRKQRKALTPKARVLKRWPGAVAFNWLHYGWAVEEDITSGKPALGKGTSAAAAWRAAAQRIGKGR